MPNDHPKETNPLSEEFAEEVMDGNDEAIAGCFTIPEELEAYQEVENV